MPPKEVHPNVVKHEMRVMVDQEGHKIAAKLFDRYIRQDEGDIARFPAFCIALDRLVSEFGGRPHQEEDGDKGRRYRDDSYTDDEDIHDDLHDDDDDDDEFASVRDKVHAALASLD